MGILTYKGATAKEALASENVELVGEWTEAQGLSEEGAAGGDPLRRVGLHELPHVPRRRLQQPRCPDLSEIGASGMTAGGVRRLRRQPGRVREHGHAAFANLGEENLALLGIFLEESKGEGGGDR